MTEGVKKQIWAYFHLIRVLQGKTHLPLKVKAVGETSGRPYNVDFSDEKEYNYTYNNSVLTAAIQYDITVAYDNSDIPYAVSKTQSGYIYYTYDNQGRLIQKNVNGSKYFYDHTEDGRIITRYGDTLISSKEDSFGRREFEELSFKTGILTRRFEYCDGEITDTHKQNGKIKSGAITQLVKRIVLSDGRVLEYEYDKEERITKVSDSLAGVTEYSYDSLGQLICESANGVKTVVTYDNYGNILTKGNNTYTYADSVWRDKLTAYNGQSITYDNQGNPTSYLGHTLVWEKGRQLKSFDTNSYTYNANGIRTSKSVNGVKHTYVLDGTKLIRETWGANTLTPLYDENDEVRGICYNDSYYYFHKNLQGDIIAITDSTGTTVAAYTYDAWGVCTVRSDISQNDIATINPYRYRGYYYDSETSLYYLQSRYYDPEIGRFVNADETKYLGATGTVAGYNLYAYCENDCVGLLDDDGSWPKTYKLVTSTKINCYAYVLGLSTYRNVPYKCKPYTVVDIYNAVYADMDNIKRDAIKLGTTYNFSLLYRSCKPFLNSYYIIAMRVGNRYVPGNGTVNDYHFWVLHENGAWSHKPGYLPSQYVGSYLRHNPSFENWRLYYGYNNKTWTFNYFYNSKTYYMLISKTIVFKRK